MKKINWSICSEILTNQARNQLRKLILVDQKWSTCSEILKPARQQNTVVGICSRAKINLTLNLFPLLVKVVSIRRIVSKIS